MLSGGSSCGVGGGGSPHIPTYTDIYRHIPPYTVIYTAIYRHIPPYTAIYRHIPPCHHSRASVLSLAEHELPRGVLSGGSSCGVGAWFACFRWVDDPQDRHLLVVAEAVHVPARDGILHEPDVRLLVGAGGSFVHTARARIERGACSTSGGRQTRSSRVQPEFTAGLDLAGSRHRSAGPQSGGAVCCACTWLWFVSVGRKHLAGHYRARRGAMSTNRCPPSRQQPHPPNLRYVPCTHSSWECPTPATSTIKPHGRPGKFCQYVLHPSSRAEKLTLQGPRKVHLHPTAHGGGHMGANLGCFRVVRCQLRVRGYWASEAGLGLGGDLYNRCGELRSGLRLVLSACRTRSKMVSFIIADVDMHGCCLR